jgi:hypothetical protein
MAVTSANVGLLYIQNYNNIPFTQPGGAGTQVFPVQANNAPFTAYPVPGQVINEVGMSLWQFGCGHGADVVRIFQDYDSGTALSCAVVCCPICTFIQKLIEPYDQIENVISFPIVIP